MKNKFENKSKKDIEKEENKYHQEEKNKKYSYSTIEKKKDNYWLRDRLILSIIGKNKIKKIFLNLMIFIIFLDFSKSDITNTNESIYSYITMKLPYSTGYLKVYSDLQGKSGCSFTKPDEVYINGSQVNNQPRQYFKNEENFVELVWKKPITSCRCMFRDCGNVLEMDLTHFDTSEVIYFDHMFYGCEKLTSINLSNFNTSSTINMQYMFYGCKKLRYLDLSNFDTSNVELMSSMFNGCESLEYLDISNFQTNSTTHFGHMFYNCRALLSLDLSNFIIINSLYMDNMFYGCGNLTSLNLSNFETPNILDYTNMFNGCSSLKILDISNFDTSGITKRRKIERYFFELPKFGIY